ncbi:unnamed protein product [Vitrella brassicaformis CCMP3155]|uniref:Uncharacterized protein n=1 Tax=Vitrella brassicaformis (strain CCMP3155) TaxID=1169540 RepID=A0A0G4FYL1_VITBC|nr:unnamed protein product [Vitrella brassicaformis CCMP3155]|eukprot:CEM20293.1 unnamed protein product [Vitrella brassicaformis CCMP3155]
MATGRPKAVFVIDGAYIKANYKESQQDRSDLMGEMFCRVLKYVQDILGVDNSQTFYYDGDPDKWYSKVTRGRGHGDRQKRTEFHSFLRQQRINVQLFDFKKQGVGYSDGWVQRGVDCSIAMKMLETAYENSPDFIRRRADQGESSTQHAESDIKMIVLFAGDSGFSEVVDKCRQLKLKVAIVGYSHSISGELKTKPKGMRIIELDKPPHCHQWPTYGPIDPTPAAPHIPFSYQHQQQQHTSPPVPPLHLPKQAPPPAAASRRPPPLRPGDGGGGSEEQKRLERAQRFGLTDGAGAGAGGETEEEEEEEQEQEEERRKMQERQMRFGDCGRPPPRPRPAAAAKPYQQQSMMGGGAPGRPPRAELVKIDSSAQQNKAKQQPNHHQHPPAPPAPASQQPNRHSQHHHNNANAPSYHSYAGAAAAAAGGHYAQHPHTTHGTGAFRKRRQATQLDRDSMEDSDEFPNRGDKNRALRPWAPGA